MAALAVTARLLPTRTRRMQVEQVPVPPGDDQPGVNRPVDAAPRPAVGTAAHDVLDDVGLDAAGMQPACLLWGRARVCAREHGRRSGGGPRATGSLFTGHTWGRRHPLSAHAGSPPRLARPYGTAAWLTSRGSERRSRWEASR